MAKSTAEKTKKKIGLSTQIFIALLIGALFGVVIHRRYQDSWKSWCKNHRILSGNHSPGCMRGPGKCSADQSGPGS